jgi:hypothetical protein
MGLDWLVSSGATQYAAVAGAFQLSDGWFKGDFADLTPPKLFQADSLCDCTF